MQTIYNKLSDISSIEIFNEKNNDQTINIFIGKNYKIFLYQFSNKIINAISFKINRTIQI